MRSFNRRSGDDPDGRLDPVRWRRPGRNVLLRSGLVAALLTLAAFIAWSGTPPEPTRCARRSPAPSAGHPSGRAEARPGAFAPATDRTDHPAVPPGTLGVPVRLAEPAALAMVRPGDRVDLLSLDEPDGEPTVIATSALVLGTTDADDPATGGLLLALTPSGVTRAVPAPGRSFAVVLRPA
ncbi:hypothetical protein [Mangrovihabitans endophyticus]|uniref:SAF domain-containing protein n=1 Tax=Mangrovihabitans endophyticus TaxID=1751298 RepID=A0A8J3BWA1_9ACTN|nr:hypothetical protein [Mangrovihabitans endophyticus]GGK83693.1 hypothetical protein GCM10012284_17260 [Mangrovihabitans endophyticus]